MKKNLKKFNLKNIVFVALVFLITILFYFIIINQDITTILFNHFEMQTELFTMAIPNGNENFGVPSILCPNCLEQGIEEWVIFGKACPRCGNPCD